MESGKTKSPFLEEVRELMRVQHYAIRTEQAYVEWIKRFILFHGKRHPDEMGESEIAAFLTHLAVNRNVAPVTQGQALNALIILYRKVLNRSMGEIPGIVRSNRKIKVPVGSADAAGSSELAYQTGGDSLVSRLFALWFRSSPDGVYSSTCEGSRF